MPDLERASVTIVGDAKATIDDATWLYNTGEKDANNNDIIKDIYGHDGSTKEQAYQISTAYQLLSFAYEVKNGAIKERILPSRHKGIISIGHKE